MINLASTSGGSPVSSGGLEPSSSSSAEQELKVVEHFQVKQVLGVNSGVVKFVAMAVGVRMGKS